MGFCKTMDDLPLVVKIILALPVLDIVWNVYRLIKSCSKKNTLGIVLAIVLILLNWTIVWIADIVFLIWKGKVWWMD